VSSASNTAAAPGGQLSGQCDRPREQLAGLGEFVDDPQGPRPLAVFGLRAE
jgi:hypothetical protein